MANSTSFSLERSVFIRERTLLVSMAFNACSIGTGRESSLFQFKPTVRIMTITAFHHAFEDLMMKRLIKVGLYLTMTTHTELGLSQLQHMDRRKAGLLGVGRTYERDRLRDVSIAR
jgi:hypothetical protein